MDTAKISDKGQLTLPADVRRKARLRPGMRVQVELRENEIVLHPLKSLADLAGIFADRVEQSRVSYDSIREATEMAVAKEVAHE